MRIKQITWRHRNDYKAVMVCEHCGHEQDDNHGYSDHFYFDRVIPAMKCDACGKDSQGKEKQQEAA